MTTGGGKAGSAPQPTTSCHECCMCGDYGLSSELFNCKVCHFRSQHRYCSNLYPKAESYRVCNWCLLSQRNDDDGDGDDHDDRTAEKTQNSSNSSSSHREGDHAIIKSKKLKSGGLIENQLGGLKGQKGNLRLQATSSSPIKKQRMPEGLPSPAARKRVIAGGGGGRVEEEKLRRTKSEGILINGGGGGGGGGITKHVFRNKVRRYKLLDEVSSQ